MKKFLLLPLAAALFAIAISGVAEARYCGLCRAACCTPCCNYVMQEDTVMRTCRKIVYEQQ